jgi:hypothetical protein
MRFSQESPFRQDFHQRNLSCYSRVEPANTLTLLKSARRAMLATLDSFIPDDAQGQD